MIYPEALLKTIQRLWTPGHRIQERVETGSGFGGADYTWVDKLTIDGILRKVSGSEPLTGGAHRPDINAIFYCDVHPEIENKDRYVSPEGEWYHIEYINDPMGMGNHFQIDLKYGGKVT